MQRTVPLMILGVWILVFGTLTLPLTEHWGQFGFESQTFSCTIGRIYSIMYYVQLGRIYSSMYYVL